MPSPGHGGKRVGAGRPTAAAQEAKKNQAATQIARFQARALQDLDALYDAQRDLAVGCYYEGCGGCQQPLPCKCRMRGATVKIYKRLPCQRAGAELLQHIKGRASVAPQVQQETEIHLMLGAVPRPPRKKGADGGLGDHQGDGGLDGEAGGAGAGAGEADGFPDGAAGGAGADLG